MSDENSICPACGEGFLYETCSRAGCRRNVRFTEPGAAAPAPSEAAYHAALNVMWPEPKEIGDTIHGCRPMGLLTALEAAYAVDFPLAGAPGRAAPEPTEDVADGAWADVRAAERNEIHRSLSALRAAIAASLIAPDLRREWTAAIDRIDGLRAGTPGGQP